MGCNKINPTKSSKADSIAIITAGLKRKELELKEREVELKEKEFSHREIENKRISK